MKKQLILITILIFSFFAFFCFAQTQSADITLQINPQYPKPNQDVTASLSSFSADLNRANIAWSLNGQPAIKNVGQKTFSFTVGSTGTQTTVAVEIMTSDGSIIDKSLTLTPNDIDLVWEAQNAYTPPFYEGKAIAPSEGIFKITALTSSNNGEKYSYNWKQDGTNMPDSSGYGKNSYSFKNSYLELNNTVSVSVSDLYGNNLGTGTINTKPGLPKILFYKKDPTLGTQWQNSLTDGFNINPNGETLVAEPYFFTPRNLNSGNLKFTWTLGGTQIDTPSTPNEISLKPTSGQSGSSTINLSVENVKTLFLSLTKTLNVNF